MPARDLVGADGIPTSRGISPARPGIAAITATRTDRGRTAIDDMQDGRTCGTATATGIVSDVVSMAATDIDDAATGDRPGPQDRDATARRTR